MPEERGYIPGRVWLYSQRSAVIFPEECGYMEEERGYMEEEPGYISVLKIVATFVSACSQGQRTHSARDQKYVALYRIKSDHCTMG